MLLLLLLLLSSPARAVPRSRRTVAAKVAALEDLLSAYSSKQPATGVDSSDDRESLAHRRRLFAAYHSHHHHAFTPHHGSAQCTNMVTGFNLAKSAGGADGVSPYTIKAPDGHILLHPPGSQDATNLIFSRYNTPQMCQEMFTDLATIGEKACGKQYATHSKFARVEKTAVLDCGTGAGATSAAFAILKLCVSTCMEVAGLHMGQKCCFIPKKYAHLFECCRELGCCPDQLLTNSTTSRGRGLRKRHTNIVRHAQGGTAAAVTVALEVESSSSGKSKFDSLLACLGTHAGAPDKCTLNAVSHN